MSIYQLKYNELKEHIKRKYKLIFSTYIMLLVVYSKWPV